VTSQSILNSYMNDSNVSLMREVAMAIVSILLEAETGI